MVYDEKIVVIRTHKSFLSLSPPLSSVEMAHAGLSLPTGLGFALQPKFSSLFSFSSVIPTRNRRTFRMRTNLGGGEGHVKRREKKFITREEEPEQLSFDELMDLSFILLSRSTTQGRLPNIEATYGIDLTQKKHIKSFLRDEKENSHNPDSIGSCSRRVVLILPVVSSGLFCTYFALAKVKTNLFNENRLLEQNKKIQEANQAPKDFPNFIREGFQVKVVISDKYVKSSSGLIYLDIQVGNGDCPKDGQQVTFHYIGYNESGRRIDSTYLRGSPANIRLGNNALVPGFEEGIHDMRPGGKRRIIIPPELGPPVGPGTFFSSKQFEVFDVELLNVKDCQRRTIAFYSDVVCN